MRCAECKWKYPSSLLNQAFLGGVGYTAMICGICALEITNKHLMVPRTHFHGEMAEATRLAAIEWRKNHPSDAPPNGEKEGRT